LKKDYFIGISIVIAVTVIGGYAYDFHRANKLLDIKITEGHHLVSDAINLSFFKLLKNALDKGEVKEIDAILIEHIKNEKVRISSESKNYDLDKTQLGFINRALSNEEPECDSKNET